MQAVDRIVTVAREQVAGRGDLGPADVRGVLDDGRTLSGTVAGLHGDVLLGATCARVSPAAALASWVALLGAMRERARARAVAGVHRGPRRGEEAAVARAGPGASYAGARQAAALRELGVIADLYDRAACTEPLLLAHPHVWRRMPSLAAGGDPLAAAAGAWTSAYRFKQAMQGPSEERVLQGRESDSTR